MFVVDCVCVGGCACTSDRWMGVPFKIHTGEYVNVSSVRTDVNSA